MAFLFFLDTARAFEKSLAISEETWWLGAEVRPVKGLRVDKVRDNVNRTITVRATTVNLVKAKPAHAGMGGSANGEVNLRF